MKLKLDSTFHSAISETVNKSYSFSKRQPSDTLLRYHKFKDDNLALQSISYEEDVYMGFLETYGR